MPQCSCRQHIEIRYGACQNFVFRLQSVKIEKLAIGSINNFNSWRLMISFNDGVNDDEKREVL